MNQVMLGAIASATVADSLVDNWCAAIRDALYNEDGSTADLDTFVVRFTDLAGRAGAPAQSVEQFTRYVQDWPDVVEQLVQNVDQLPDLYRQARTSIAPQPGPAAPAAPATAQPAAPAVPTVDWNDYLAENGPRWDGTLAGWPAFRAWFASDATTRGIGGPAEGFLRAAEAEQALASRIAFFGRYGVVIKPPGQPRYDPADWNKFLAENGGRWNGTLESWPAFRSWFVAQARQVGLGQPATGFLVAAEGVADAAKRIEFFAGYRVTITPPAAPSQAAPSPQPAAVPSAPESLDKTEDTADDKAEDTAEETVDVEEDLVTDDGLPVLDDTDLDDDLLQQVIDIQSALGLTPDGVVGAKTWEALVEFVGDDVDLDTDTESAETEAVGTPVG